MGAIRAAAHCVVRDSGEVLLIRIQGHASDRVVFRAIGGGFEFGESAERAVRREVREELGTELFHARQLAVLEGFINWNGVEEHEVVFVFEGEPRDKSILMHDHPRAVEATGLPLDLHWLDPFQLEVADLYPDGLLPLLRQQPTSLRTRAVALVALLRDDEILLMYGDDSVKKRPFHRAPGGGIEFGESAEAAARREIREEFGVELDAVRHLGTLENIFMFEGSPGHEVVFVFEAEWPAHLPRTATVEAHEDDGVAFTTRWFKLADLPPPGHEVVPPGFLELLAQQRPPTTNH